MPVPNEIVTLLDGLGSPACVFDTTLKLQFANYAFLDLARIAMRDIRRGISLQDCLHLDVLENAESVVERVAGKNENVRFREVNGKNKDGEAISVEASFVPIPAAADRPACVAMVLLDLTQEATMQQKYKVMYEQEKKAREELAEFNRKLNLLVEQRTQDIADIMDNVRIGLLTLDEHLTVGRNYSKHTASILGTNELAGRNLAQVFYPDDTEKQESVSFILAELFSGQSSYDLLRDAMPDDHIPWVRPDDPKGAARRLDLSFDRIRDADGKVVKIMVSLSDVTQELELAAALKRKEKENAENLALVSILAEHGLDSFANFVAKHLGHLAEAESLLSDTATLNRDNIALLNRLFHTLKGDASTFRLAGIVDRAHELEEVFLARMEQGGEIGEGETAEIQESLALLKKEIGRISQKVKDISGAGDEGETRGQTRGLSVMVPVRHIDDIVRRIRSSDVESLAVSRDSIAEQIAGLKAVPCSKLFNRFPNMVERIADRHGKKIRMDIAGKDLLLDACLLDRIGDSLVHIVRNAADHGIEPPEERVRTGKDEEGVIQLAARREDSRIVISVKDDGGGINLEKLGENAVRKGIVSRGDWEKLPPQDKKMMVFHPGLSSKADSEVSNISGRGIGMDVVKAVMQDLGGRIELHSEQGVGTEVRLIVLPQNKR